MTFSLSPRSLTLFTVPSLGLNLAMASESTIVAYFTTGARSAYVWLCETACKLQPTVSPVPCLHQAG